ncbi:MAG: Methyltransferase type 11 [Cyanobacteria bacterium RYN_339]|nr:Methyltransferase type 11 [Cyanobacteria bacterium RYN_339]
MVARDPASYTDPNGYVYWQDGRVYRRVHTASHLKAVLAAFGDDPRLATARVVSEDAQGLVLEHGRVAPASYPQEWPAAMLKDAATLVVEVALAAAEKGFGLADGHPWNVFFDGPTPRFLDWGSFTPADPRLLWPAQAQFNRFLFYPLHLYAAGHAELARARLADLALGVGPALALKTLPTAYRLTHPKATLGLLANRAAERLTETPRAGTAPTATGDPAMLAKLRPGYFKGILRDVAAIRLPGPTGGWAAYYAACPSMERAQEDAKLRLMEQLLARFKPATVLDLGANTGRFSLLAARAGARVTALDQDDASMALLYREAKAERLPILPLVLDLGNPTPATGWCAAQRPNALTRFASDMALFLALIHHLVFTGNHSLEQVAQLARRVARRTAVVEWVGPQDAMAKYLARTATKDFGFYTLENLVAALEAQGFAVEALAPHAPDRRLLVCSCLPS